jgi:hypothetical protein
MLSRAEKIAIIGVIVTALGIESAAKHAENSLQSWRLHGNLRDVLLFLGEKMKRHSLLIAVLLCFAFPLLAQNPELKALAEEDQVVRQENPAKGITRKDRDRGKLVLELLAKGAARTPEDKFNAALVLQHTPLIFCGKQLVSVSPDNYLLAHYLFKGSFEAGYTPARIMVANSIDRYMSMTEGRQKYGTNRITNQKTGKDEWVPIDRATPDSERAKYGVPPLVELLKQFPEQRPSKSPPPKK